MNGSIEPKSSTTTEVIKTALNIVSGLIPYGGGILSAIAAQWSDHDQENINEFLKYQQNMFEMELREQMETIREIMHRLEQLNIDVTERIKSSAFQSLVQRCFRDWSGINSKCKRDYIRNLLVNAASITTSNDDIIRLFIDWINQYSELHFQVITCIYKNQNGISRGQIWKEIGQPEVREDSSDADLYKFLIRDLSTGGIIRQHRLKDYHGNFVVTPRNKSKSSTNTLESAFESTKQYELTDLGKSFVHYIMSEVSTKIEHHEHVL